MPEPPMTHASYLHFLTEKHLMGSRCISCNLISLPPRPICPHCGGSHMEWVEMPTHGKLLTFTCIHVARSFMALQGYDRQHPYCVGVVELDNGARTTSRILGVDPLHPENIPIGLALQGEFVPVGGEFTTPSIAFRPVLKGS